VGYKVCIPCAGIGSRLGDLTKFINKSLVSIANRPTLSHIIEQFPEDTEFVIALGYQGHLVREFINLAYPDRKFYFTEVVPFEGPGSGLGLSLLSCKKYLQEPFIFTSCDTLVKEAIPAPESNWMGYADAPDLENYRTLSIVSNEVKDICEKRNGISKNYKPYIGLAGINDFQKFWAAMIQDTQIAINTGEVHGMRSLLQNYVKGYAFTWSDTGNIDNLCKARELYVDDDAPNILEKANEAIWFVEDNVIKYSDDKKFISNRVKRVEMIKEFVPEITGSGENMYRYKKVQGNVLSEVVTLPLFEKFLEHCSVFWKKKPLLENQATEFKKKCLNFYRDKTFDRIKLFYNKFNTKDGTETINEMHMPTLNSLLGRVDWDWLATGMPGRFHGDFHFENILHDKTKNEFTFLDWRQEFSGSLEVGDIYYDFAKLLHGLIVNHEVIANNEFNIEWNINNIYFDIKRKKSLVECEFLFETWITEQGYDLKKTRILTALIFLNIAALHHNPYSLFLYALGKIMLKNELED